MYHIRIDNISQALRIFLDVCTSTILDPSTCICPGVCTRAEKSHTTRPVSFFGGPSPGRSSEYHVLCNLCSPKGTSFRLEQRHMRDCKDSYHILLTDAAPLSHVCRSYVRGKASSHFALASAVISGLTQVSLIMYIYAPSLYQS